MSKKLNETEEYNPTKQYHLDYQISCGYSCFTGGSFQISGIVNSWKQTRYIFWDHEFFPGTEAIPCPGDPDHKLLHPVRIIFNSTGKHEIALRL